MLLFDLSSAGAAMPGLFDAATDRKGGRLMAAVDRIDGRFGRGSVVLGRVTKGAPPADWTMRQTRLSPRYTTRWTDLPTARMG